MKHYIFSILALFCALFSFTDAEAQTVSFKASAPLNVSKGERFRVEFVLNNSQGSNFAAPDFQGLSVLSGPNISTGTSVRWVNGQQSSSSTETYTYFVEASQEGTATVSAATIVAGGKTYTSNTLSISVQGSRGQSSGSAQQSQSQASTYTRPSGTLADDDIILKMELSKSSCYKGEAILAQLKLYTRVGISNISNPKYAAFNGFWTVELETPQTPQAVRATLGDKVYESFVLRQWLLYPQRSGTMQIEQTSLTATAQIITQSSGNSLFDQFFGGGSSVNNVDKHLSTGGSKIEVKSLPAGAPVGLDPAVGDFRISSEISASEISANSAGSLKVTLEGSGDFPLIEAPVFTLPAEFEQYDTKTSEKLRTSASGQSGSRTWEFPFIARSEGEFVIPSIEFAYFNPKTNKYSTLKTPEYPITVTRDNGSGSGGSGMSVVSGVSKEDLKILGQDIRYIKSEALTTSSNHNLLYSFTFFLIMGLVVLGVAISTFVLRATMAKRADVARNKNRKASKVAIKRLKVAKKQLDAGSRNQFFDETLKALWGFVGDKYGVEVSELNKSRIIEEFNSRLVIEEIQSEFLALIEDCEIAHYAPVESIDMAAVYQRSLSIFDKL